LSSVWLERLLYKARLFVVTRLSPQSPGRTAVMTFSVYCIVSLFYCVFFLSFPALHNIFHTPTEGWCQGY